MCGGEMKIESTPGEGTVATVILPKEGQKNEDTVSWWWTACVADAGNVRKKS